MSPDIQKYSQETETVWKILVSAAFPSLTYRTKMKQQKLLSLIFLESRNLFWKAEA